MALNTDRRTVDLSAFPGPGGHLPGDAGQRTQGA